MNARRHHAQPLFAIMYAFLLPKYHSPFAHLSLLESSWESSDVVGKLAVVGQELDISTINQDLSGGLLLHVFLTAKRGETPVLGNDDLLATRELVL